MLALGSGISGAQQIRSVATTAAHIDADVATTIAPASEVDLSAATGEVRRRSREAEPSSLSHAEGIPS